MLPITAFYAAPLALAFVALATRVIRARRLYHQPMGTAHRLVERAARAHGNFAEAVPLPCCCWRCAKRMACPPGRCMCWA